MIIVTKFNAGDKCFYFLGNTLVPDVVKQVAVMFSDDTHMHECVLTEHHAAAHAFLDIVHNGVFKTEAEAFLSRKNKAATKN